MLETLVLYVLPILARVAVDPPTTAVRVGDALLSIVPLLIVLPAPYLPRAFPNEEVEHVWRHVLYAFAFTVSAATSIRWDVVATGDPTWKWPLIAYLAVGGTSLWWFALSHVLEMRLDPTLYTHQGDLAVLPLTFVAIATYAFYVPDEAFRYARSVIFYVPIVVAWATLHFIAYTGFSRDRITTHGHERFQFRAHCALIIASVHLLLLEMRGSALLFQFFPLVAAVLCQVTTRAEHRPEVRSRGVVATYLVAGGVGAAVGALLDLRFDTVPSYAVGVGAGIVGIALSLVSRRRWPAPAALYAGLGATALLLRDGQDVRGVDSVVIAAAFYLAYKFVDVLAPRTRDPIPYDITPQSVVTGRDDRPQDDATCSIVRVLRRVFDVPVGHGFSSTEVLANRFGPSHPTCPEAYKGVWWMRGNGFPMECVAIDQVAWNDETSAVVQDGRHITFEATVAGWLTWAGSALLHTRVDTSSKPWIRTDVSTRVLDAWPSTYWLVPDVEPDALVRVVFDGTGRVIWQYRMLRILRSDGSRTRYYTDYVKATAGKRYM